ncbi:signal recognition particle receptor subunit alpha, partial [Candidatus Babeliales bacterium]|nr:signal recognition particle receptor subunit alpha [Candidatus Babeliales bacterium]
MFSFLKKTVVNLFSGIKSKLCSLFSKPINKNSLIELKTILLEADVGIKLANELTIKLEQWMQKTSNQSGSEARTFLEAQLLQILEKLPKSKTRSPEVLLLLGINGSGKTTTAAKLAHRFAQQGKKTLLV